MFIIFSITRSMVSIFTGLYSCFHTLKSEIEYSSFSVTLSKIHRARISDTSCFGGDECVLLCHSEYPIYLYTRSYITVTFKCSYLSVLVLHRMFFTGFLGMSYLLLCYS